MRYAGALRSPSPSRIEAISVHGNKKTKTSIILREMETKPGDVLDARQLQKDLMRLRNLDYFEMLDFQPADASEPGKVVLDVNVREKKTGTVSVGLGYSSRERLVGFADITEHNFRGVGQQIGLRWEAGQFTNRSGYEFSFADPWMLGKRTSLGFQLYNRTTNRPLLSNVVLNNAVQEINTWVFERRKGLGVSVGKPAGEFTRLLLDLRSDDVLYSTVPGYLDADQDAALTEQVLRLSDGRVTSATLRGVRDTRDLAINPHRGSFYSVSTELAGGPLGGTWSFGKVVDFAATSPSAAADGSNQMALSHA